ncbi:MAG TPA: hypothetical protein DDY78_29195 [Planctomycetales bacterium]|jgi:hypothetical protein|nr:hypothetical protein [Planctomycetales bacterium]
MNANERTNLSITDPKGWPEWAVSEVPDEFAGPDQSPENLERCREEPAEDWNAFVDLLAPKPKQLNP